MPVNLRVIHTIGSSPWHVRDEYTKTTWTKSNFLKSVPFPSCGQRNQVSHVLHFWKISNQILIICDIQHPAREVEDWATEVIGFREKTRLQESDVMILKLGNV